MKFIAHSVVPSHHVPYMHLGYVSGMPVNNASPRFAFVIFLLVIAAYVWKRSRGWGIAFLVFAVTVCGWAIVSYNQDKAISQTHTRARMLLYHAPVDHVDLQHLHEASAELHIPFMDVWNHPFRLSQHTSNGDTYYELTSMGPDGKFNTTDDITVRR